MSYLKTKENNNDVFKFLNAIEDVAKKEDCFQLLAKLENISGFKAKMWGNKIVGFGAYTYKTKAGKEGEWFLIGFTPNKDKISIHLMHGLQKETRLLSKLGKHKIGKGCLYIKKLSDIDMNILDELLNSVYTNMKAGKLT